MRCRRFAALLCSLIGVLGPVRAQDAALKDTFEQAKVLWATQGDKDGAAARFEQVLETLQPKAGTLGADWLNVLCETCNWLAVLDDRTPAKRPRVQKDLETILDLDPDFEVDRNVTNARLLGVFEGLRSSRLGKVKVGLDPSGGTLLLDGKPCVLPPGSAKHLPPGMHEFHYGRPGYQSVDQSVDISLRENKPIELKLVRTSSTLTFNTFPSGAEIVLDGKPLGTTHGHAPASLSPMAQPLGLAPEQLSADFVLTDLAPGKHIIEVRAPCFRTKRIALGEELSTPFADHALEPFKLEPSQGLLSVGSGVPGGEAFLSGRSLGPLPVKDAPVCAGTFDLQVKFPAGGYAQTLEIGEGKSVDLQVRPKPRMAYLGFEGADDFAGRERILDMLQRFGGPREGGRLSPPGAERDHSGSPPEDQGRQGGRADLAGPSGPPASRSHRIELVLATLGGEEEKYLVQPLESDPLEDLASRMNAEVRLSEPWSGLTLIDLPGEPGPWVLEADEAARKAGVKPSRPLTSLNGKPVPDVRTFRNGLAEAVGGKLVVSQGEGDVTLEPHLQPVEIPVNASSLCYPLLLADLRLRLPGAAGDEAGLLQLQQALALMHFHLYGKALEVLRDARVGTSTGVCQGTLDYYIGLNLLRLGNTYLPEATQALNQSLQYPQATLFGPEGPRVAPLAKQALEDLKP